MTRPIVAITMGDPAGIGPEIVKKALEQRDIYDTCRPLVVGDAGVFRRIGVDVIVVDGPEGGQYLPGKMDILDLKTVPQGFEMGGASAAGGRAAYLSVERAVELAMAGRVQATATAPLNKAALNMAGYPFPGHTEIYAHLTGSQRYTMMLAMGDFRVVHVSTHVSLKGAIKAVTRERVLETIILGYEALVALGVQTPRIAVAALNPHAGEGGLFGDEEGRFITPAIGDARERGIDVFGPEPPDSVFAQALGGRYNMVVAMYHDQGHIPVKVVGFEFGKAGARIGGINVTLGLPIIRASVDHGTAFDIAGRGVADPTSMVEAIEYAARLGKDKTEI